MFALLLLFAASPVAYLPATDITITDGDTVSASLVLTPDIQLIRQSIRSVNYDSWESFRSRRSKPFTDFTDTQWKAEQVKGAKAKDELAALVSTGDLYIVLRGRDVYGRLLAEFWVYREATDELIDVAEVMKAKGHLRK